MPVQHRKAMKVRRDDDVFVLLFVSKPFLILCCLSVSSLYLSECPSRPPTESTTMNLSGNKRRAEDNDDVGNESGGYNSDDEGASSEKASLGNPASSQVPDTTLSSSPQKPPANKATKGKNKKTKFLDENKREERNAREKERSFRISRQINELRNLLASGGVIVPKGTKSSVLTEAANYIRMLQQHQYRSEMLVFLGSFLHCPTLLSGTHLSLFRSFHHAQRPAPAHSTDADDWWRIPWTSSCHRCKTCSGSEWGVVSW